MESFEHAVFNQDSFYSAFEQDLRNAQALVLIQSPFIAVRRIQRLWRHLQSCIRRGVRICASVQEPRRLDSADSQVDAFEEARQLLVSLGLHVSIRPGVHEKLAVIDESILWEGSLNILSHNLSLERMTRWVSRGKVYEAVVDHGLASCADCEASNEPSLVTLGAFLLKRRKLLGITQAELARKAGIAQCVISDIESGKRDYRVSTLFRVCNELRLGYRCLPQFMTRAIDELLRKCM